MRYSMILVVVLSFFVSDKASAQTVISTEEGTFTLYGSGTRIYSIAFDNNSNVWCGISNKISKLISKAYPWEDYDESEGLECGGVNSIAFDKDNILWVGGDDGISKFDGTSFVNYSGIDDITFKNTYSVFIDHDNKKWFGKTKKLISYNDTTWSVFDSLPGIYLYIYSITEDNYYKKWIGTWDGITTYNENQNEWKWLTEQEIGFRNSPLKSIAVDSKNIKWFITPYLFFSYNDTTWVDYTDWLPFKNLNCIASDNNDIIWIGSYNGLIRFDGENIKTYTYFDNSLSENLKISEIYALAVDENNNKWFGCRDMLVSFKDNPVSVSKTTPFSFSLLQNYPNPFNLSTTISFSLSSPGFTKLSVYNMAGQKVRGLVGEKLSAGEHTTVWDGKDAQGKAVSSGIYFSVLKAGGRTEAGKMMMVK